MAGEKNFLAGGEARTDAGLRQIDGTMSKLGDRPIRGPMAYRDPAPLHSGSSGMERAMAEAANKHHRVK